MLDIKEFANPSSEFRIKPFWFWNSRLRQEELVRQIREMYDKGIGGFFIHARFGLETGYLSEEWFDAIRVSIGEAEKLGMEVWLYDENPFPSGIGDLKVSSRPEYRNRYIECIEFSLEPGWNLIPASSGEIVMAGYMPEGRFKALETRWTGEAWEIGNTDTKQVPGVVFVKKVLDNPNNKIFGIDYMNPEAVQCYIQSTHQVYEQHLGDFFGTAIKGVFTDEPTLLPWHQDIDWYRAREDGRVIAWDDQILQRLRQEGWELEEILEAVFYGSNDADGWIRRRFWEVVSTLYEESFFKAYHTWCSEHNLILTGHVLLEEGLYFNHIFQGNILRNLEWLDMPGTDQLCNVAEQNSMEYMVGTAPYLPKMRTNVQGQKTVSSAAHLSGKNRVLSESFGLGGWGLSLQDMKKVIDWQYSLGINQLCVHAFFYSIEGFRKYDAPPCHMHNSFWPHYRMMADYVARLSYTLSRGCHQAEVAVLYPSSSFRSVYTVGLQQQADKQVSDVFDMLCATLPKLHYDYDVIGEHHLTQAQVSEGCLQIAGERFKVLAVPSGIGLGAECLQAIGKFAASGGIVLSWGCEQIIVRDNTGDGKLFPMGIPDLDQEDGVSCFKEWLREALVEALDPDIQVLGAQGESVYALHRSLEDEEIYFFANTSSQEAADLEIRVAAEGSVAVLDTLTGNIRGMEEASQCGGRTVFHYSFAPYESLLIRVGKQDIPLSAVKEERKTSTYCRIPLEGDWEFDIRGDNSLPLEDWSFNVRTFTWGAEYRYRNRFFVWDPVETVNLMLDDVEYRSAFMGLMDLTVSVNGDTVGLAREADMESGFKLYEITSLIRPGWNAVELLIRHSAWSGQPHTITSPVKLLGRFSLMEKEGITGIGPLKTTLRSGSWTEQGYPSFSGTGMYRKEFLLEQLPLSVHLDLEGIAEGAAVYVNGKFAGTCAWSPWQLDISAFVQPGANRLELQVFNTMSNWMESDERPSGLLRPIHLILGDAS